MDVLRIYEDFNVEHATEGHKHARSGWVNVECPFCTDAYSNPGLHLGWNIVEEYFKCWRCGWKPPVLGLAKVLDMSVHKVLSILPAYGIVTSVVKKKWSRKKDFMLPNTARPLNAQHKQYLKGRGYNVKEIVKLWDLKGTGPVAKLDDLDYRFRVIIPFKWNGEVVSFDSRDITNKQQNKYQACPKNREAIEHKKILYGNQEEWGQTGIGVEGPTDVWKLGPLSCATSGIEYTPAQVRIIANTFKRFAVVFDDELQAQRQAKKLVDELRFRGVDAWNVKIKGDPGALSNKRAKELVKSIINKK